MEAADDTHEKCLAKHRNKAWAELSSISQVSTMVLAYLYDVFRVQEANAVDKTYADASDFLTKMYPPAQQRVPGGVCALDFAQQLKNVETAVVAGAIAETGTDWLIPIPAQEYVPDRQLGTGRRHREYWVRLWQLGYSEKSSVRGPASSCDALEVLMSALDTTTDGVKTNKYPLEVLFDCAGVAPGHKIPDFSVAISVGTATTTGCFLMLHSILALDLQSKLRPELWQKLCPRLLTALHLKTIYDPAENSEQDVFKSIATKCQAAARQRPNILGLFNALDVSARSMVAAGSRPG